MKHPQPLRPQELALPHHRSSSLEKIVDSAESVFHIELVTVEKPE